MVSKSRNLTIRVSEETTGKYYCRAVTIGFPEITAEAYVYIKGKPVIRQHPNHFGMLGDTVRLDCNIYSIPKPDKITWSFNSREIGLDSEEGYQVWLISQKNKNVWYSSLKPTKTTKVIFSSARLEDMQPIRLSGFLTPLLSIRKTIHGRAIITWQL